MDDGSGERDYRTTGLVALRPGPGTPRVRHFHPPNPGHIQPPPTAGDFCRRRNDPALGKSSNQDPTVCKRGLQDLRVQS